MPPTSLYSSGVPKKIPHLHLTKPPTKCLLLPDYKCQPCTFVATDDKKDSTLDTHKLKHRISILFDFALYWLCPQQTTINNNMCTTVNVSSRSLMTLERSSSFLHLALSIVLYCSSVGIDNMCTINCTCCTTFIQIHEQNYLVVLEFIHLLVSILDQRETRYQYATVLNHPLLLPLVFKLLHVFKSAGCCMDNMKVIDLCYILSTIFDNNSTENNILLIENIMDKDLISYILLLLTHSNKDIKFQSLNVLLDILSSGNVHQVDHLTACGCIPILSTILSLNTDSDNLECILVALDCLSHILDNGNITENAGAPNRYIKIFESSNVVQKIKALAKIIPEARIIIKKFIGKLPDQMNKVTMKQCEVDPRFNTATLKLSWNPSGDDYTELVIENMENNRCLFRCCNDSKVDTICIENLPLMLYTIKIRKLNKTSWTAGPWSVNLEITRLKKIRQNKVVYEENRRLRQEKCFSGHLNRLRSSIIQINLIQIQYKLTCSGTSTTHMCTHNINNLSIQKDLLLKNIQSMNASVIKLIRICKNNKKLLNDTKREELELLFVETDVLQKLSKKMCEKMNKLYNERKKVKQWLNQFHVQDVPACTNEYNDLDFNSKYFKHSALTM